MAGHQLTPEWTAGFEEDLQIIAEEAYANMSSDLWWELVAKRVEGDSKKQRMAWIVDTASLETLEDGEMTFEDMMAHQYEYEHLEAGKGLILNRNEFTDKDANGIDMATAWNRQIAAWMAYWPQDAVAQAFIANPTAYDGISYFANNHPCNPLAPAGGATYSNLLTAFPLNAATVDIALDNLNAALAYIRSEVRTPDGRAPRRLKPTHILHPPAMSGRVQQLTSAQFISQDAASGGGSADISGMSHRKNMAEPVECAELAAVYGGSDADCYIVCSDVVSGTLGGFIYSVLEDFEIISHNPTTAAELALINQLQWTTRGRNVVAPGHPFAIFKIVGS